MDLIARDLLIEFINSLPTEQPDVIRCRDCRYFIYDKKEHVWICDTLGDLIMSPDDYCSYGERKEDYNVTGSFDK